MGSVRRSPLASELTGLVRDVRALAVERGRHRPRPPKGAFVIDVGAGQAAHPNAAVVVDKYPLDSSERSAAERMDFSRPLVVADGHALPFADGSFDYVIASHVLEHATDPVHFAAELARVAPAG